MSDQTELLRVGDERVPVLSIFYDAGEGFLGFGNAKGRVFLADTKDWSIDQSLVSARNTLPLALPNPKNPSPAS